MPALRQVPGDKWLEVAMIRVNHKGTRMDTEDYRNRWTWGTWDEDHNAYPAGASRQGMGVISMKLVGEVAEEPRGPAEGDAVFFY